MTNRYGMRCRAGVSAIIAIIAISSASGCGGSSSHCDGISGQFKEGAQTAGRTVIVYSLTNCDANGQNCQQHQVAQTTTDNTGQFSASGLPDGNYLAVVYAADNTTVIDQQEFNIPGVCSGGSSN